MTIEKYYNEAIGLLQGLISTPSFSTEEDKTAALLIHFFKQKNIPTQRHFNNLWLTNFYFDKTKPSILLNTHHDTVKPNTAYTNNPFEPLLTTDALYGLGSTDAGASLVCLVQCFLHFYEEKKMPYNIVLALTAEEEISGKNGIESILNVLPENISFGIVGEPTQMDLAISEKGLLVIDCISKGIAGHAARNEGDNAIFHAIKDIQWFQTFAFPKISTYLGANKMTVTMINAGSQHNIIPEKCEFTVDIRLNELYTHNEVLEIIKLHTNCEILPRSFRLKSTHIDDMHPIVQAGIQCEKKTYGSPTTSDKALLPFPALKCGPGHSAQSHSANEFILLKDIKKGIEGYIKMLSILFNN